MNGGPTVRRLYRERAIAETSRHAGSLRRRSLGSRPSRSDPAAPVPCRHLQGPELLPTPVFAARRCPRNGEPAQRSPFPLSVASIFGLPKYRNVIVLNRQISVVIPEPRSSADVAVESRTLSGFVHVMGSVDNLLKKVIQLRLASLNHWAAASEGPGRYAEVDRYFTGSAAALGELIDRFVHEELIPELRLLDQQADGVGGGPGPGQQHVSATLADLEDRFAFVGDRWYELVEFYGNSPRHQLALHLRDESLLAVRDESTTAAVARYDALLRDELLATLAPQRIGSGSPCDLYRDERYAVIRTPRGRYFVSQFLPAYVVESIDRKLYYFDAAEIGIAITSTDVRKVISPQAVQIMHAYRHMFVGVMGDGHYLCMPRHQSYFDELHRLPLEYSLLRHLESGRLTLCAGYQPVNAGVHPIHATGRRTINLAEARKRHLPIYWYDHPRRALRSRVMSMFT